MRPSAISLFLVLCGLPLVAGANVASRTPVDGYPAFALGADVSATQQIEQTAYPSYYRLPSTDDRNLTNIPLMMAESGMDAVRLRVWVDPKGAMVCDGFKAKINGATVESTPTGGYCGPEEMVEMAQRFARQGLRLMVSFQMSDTWADPARQYVPAAWASCTTADEMRTKVVEHVSSVVETLKRANVQLAWAQIGNETSTGMLKYPLPATSGAAVSELAYGCGISSSNTTTTKNFVQTFSAARDAIKSAYPDCKIILHIAEGNNWSKVNWTLTNLKRQGFSTDICDIVGLSLYPCNNSSDASTYNYTAKWQADVDQTLTTMKTIKSNYGFSCMICEFGMNNEWSLSTPADVASTQAGNIAQCNTDVAAMTVYLYANAPEANCEGAFYWEPQTDYLNGYQRGACVSADPGTSWPRDRVTPNPYWSTTRAASALSTWNLKDFAYQPAPDPAPLYIAGDFNAWDYAAPDVMTYDDALGVYTATVDCTTDGKVVGISTAVADDFKSHQIAPALQLVNGVTGIFVNTVNNFALPYPAVWHLTVNTTLRTIMAFTDDAEPGSSEEFTKLYVYHWTDKDNFVGMSTEDGVAYHLTGLSAPQWFNFKIATDDWTFSAGGVEVAYDTDVALTVNASWNAWTAMAVSESDYWWFNAETNTLRICASAHNPWAEEVVDEPDSYSANYDNSLTDWPIVYAYVLDADGNQLTGAWPGKRLVAKEGALWSLDFAATSVPTEISFSNGIYRNPLPAAFEDDKTYRYDDVSVESIFTHPAAAGPATYYNLQGIPVANPASGLYIRRTSTSAEKVFIR